MHYEHSDAMVLIKNKDSVGNVIKMTLNALFKSKSDMWDI
jgi:hypothetical protein